MINAEATPRERGWRRLLPALALFLFAPAVPQLRAVLPIEQTLLLLVPALAACAWLAWNRGGRLWMAVAWTLLAIIVLSRPMAGGAAFVAFARGWALLLCAAFGAIGLVARARPFFGRALGALAVCGVGTVLALAVAGASRTRVERVISAELSDRVDESVASLHARTSTPDWQDLQQKNPDGAKALTQMFDEVEAQIRDVAPFGQQLFPAVLLMESLAALGLAWSLHHRLSRSRLGPPLAPLREFRFEDQLIWGVIAGLVVMLVPRLAAWRGLGWNLLLFFGALYALRGLGVMLWFLVAPGHWAGMALVVAVVLLWPLWSVPLVIGLSDSRFDWRRRVRPSSEGKTQ